MKYWATPRWKNKPTCCLSLFCCTLSLFLTRWIKSVHWYGTKSVHFSVGGYKSWLDAAIHFPIVWSTIQVNFTCKAASDIGTTVLTQLSTDDQWKRNHQKACICYCFINVSASCLCLQECPFITDSLLSVSCFCCLDTVLLFSPAAPLSFSLSSSPLSSFTVKNCH